MSQLCSVYRLVVDQLEQALDPEREGERHDFRLAGHSAIRVDVGRDEQPPNWGSALAQMTGYPFDHPTRSASAVLLVDLRTARYALTFGPAGRWLLRDGATEPDFGVRIALRTLQPDQVGAVARVALDLTSRTDQTQVPAGANVRFFTIDEYAEVVKRLSGTSGDLAISQQRRSGTVRMDGSHALRLRLVTTPDGLIHDLAAIEAAYHREPHDELAFIEGLRPMDVRHGESLTHARLALAAALTEPDSDRVGLVMPLGLDAIDIDEFTVDVEGYRETFPEPDLAPIRKVLGDVSGTERIDALWRGHVWLSVAGEDGPERTRLRQWLAADLRVGQEWYVFHGGDFYRMTDRYRQTLHTGVDRLLQQAPALTLPAWPRDEEERDYCERVGREAAGFVKLDRKLMRDRTHKHGIEICDLFGPAGELICVKRARGSQELSHLFFQAMVSANSFWDGGAAYQALRSMLPPDRRSDVQLRPHFVFAIQLTKGELTADSLFSFAKVGLFSAARHLERLAMNVSVLSISEI